MARRLADRPGLFAVAAEQYLLVADAVRNADERLLMARLFRRAADEASVFSNYPLMERFLAATVPLIDPADTDQLIAVHTDRHAALCRLGRLEEADEIFQAITRMCTRPEQRTPATEVQVISLTNRNRPEEAMRLGLDQLRQLGLAIPDRADLNAEVDRGLDAFYRWLDRTDESDDSKSGLSDPPWRGAAMLVNRLMPTAYIFDKATMSWLTVKTLESWAGHGLDPALLYTASCIAFVTIGRRHDYRTGYRMLKRILAAGWANGYEPEVWEAEFVYVISTGHWFDALEDNVSEARRTLEGLVRGGSLQYACWTHIPLAYNLLDCAPSLDDLVSEVDEALAMAARTGNGQAEEIFQTVRQLERDLRGEAVQSAADEAAQLSALAGTYLHINQALTAAIFDRPDELARHTAAAMSSLPTIDTTYATALARMLRALALAGQARAAAAGPREAILAELDGLVDWLDARAADAPVNFRHLLRLAEAERAWAAGDFREAAYAFDLARREVAALTRPWHRALILERAARFYLAHGMEATGLDLLAAARRQYLGWGATAKVSQLDWVHPTLRVGPAGTEPVPRPPAQPAGSATVTTGTLDLLGIVAASRALSSETSIDGLRARVGGILSEMTGATRVHLLLRDENGSDWLVPTDAGDAFSLGAASLRRLLPVSIIRYAERTQEPVDVADATRDDRFRRDPYFLDLDRCSLLAVPIVIRGVSRAMLLLENRMIRGAFSTEHLEGIMLIAGQLAVSLENASVYASLERKVAERTRQLAAANQRLEQLLGTDSLTGLPNRRRLDEVLHAEWRRAQPRAAPMAVAMIDIDHFKLYNDHFGHATGDQCLQRVAGCLAANVRATDMAARYGGEEFTVVLPDTDADTAAEVARRLCCAVRELAITHPPTAEGVVTVSVGVAATVPGPDDDVAALVELADAWLYLAKRGGRGRVEVADSRPAAQ